MLEDIRLVHLITSKFAPVKMLKKKKKPHLKKMIFGRIYWSKIKIASWLPVIQLITSFDEGTQVNVDFQMIQTRLEASGAVI